MFNATLIGGVMAINALVLAKMLGLRSRRAGWSAALVCGILTIYLAVIWDDVVFDKLDRVLIGSVFCS